MSKKYVFGIDLGTTYSCVAYVDDTGHPVVVPNSEGNDITPSVVQIDEDGNAVVGDVAKDNAVLEADSTVEFVKRQIGRTAVARTINGVDYSPEEISALILKKIAKDVRESGLGVEVKDVVITCPAYFGDAERLATANAGRIAGLNVMEIIKEPLAAAIHFGVTRATENKNYMVFDLGGGTFDVTIMRFLDGTIEEVCSDGDHELGGKDWDDKLILYLKDRFTEELGMDVDFSPDEMQELRSATEKAKKTLSGKPATAVRVTAGGATERFEVTREIFDEITAVERERTFDITDLAVESARAKGVEVDEILLVGGSTIMPQIRESIVAKYGIEPKSHEPSQAVAKGAALYAVMVYVENQKAFNEWKASAVTGASEAAPVEDAENYAEELNVSPLLIGAGTQPIKIITATTKSYGVVVDPEVISNLILKNTPMPDGRIEQAGLFQTKSDNQHSADIRICESDYETKDLFPFEPGLLLGSAELALPPGLPAGSPIQVTLTLDRQGRLHVHGKDLASGKEVHADLQVKGALSESQIDDLTAKTSALQIRDF